MKKLSNYPSYKSTSETWMQEIPEHWSVFRLKHVFGITKRIVGEIGHDVLSITQKGIKVKDTESGAGQLSMDYSKYQQVDQGDFAMNHMDLLTGFVDISKFDGVISPDYRVFKLIQPESDARYLLYILQLSYTQRIFFKHGKGVSMLGRWRLPAENFKNFLIPIPLKPEQIKIAAFLDYKIKKIDRFIAKKKQLIKLLNEQKAAIINQAVTKGLDAKAKMKPSGIDWLGDVPEHWEVKKLWLIIKSSDLGGNYDSGESSEGIPLMKMGNLGRGKINLSKIECIEKDQLYDPKHILKFGDFLFNTRNSADLVGKVSLRRDDLPFALYNSNILKIEFKKGILNQYMNHLFNSKSIINALRLISKGTTSVSAIYYKNLSKMEICLPNSIEEQIEIIDFIDKECSIINKTIEVAI